jgi:hypothetical protein
MNEATIVVCNTGHTLSWMMPSISSIFSFGAISSASTQPCPGDPAGDTLLFDPELEQIGIYWRGQIGKAVQTADFDVNDRLEDVHV